jgi:hypothetical protein
MLIFTLFFFFFFSSTLIRMTMDCKPRYSWRIIFQKFLLEKKINLFNFPDFECHMVGSLVVQTPTRCHHPSLMFMSIVMLSLKVKDLLQLSSSFSASLKNKDAFCPLLTNTHICAIKWTKKEGEIEGGIGVLIFCHSLIHPVGVKILSLDFGE